MPFAASNPRIYIKFWIVFNSFLNKSSPYVIHNKQPPSKNQRHYYCWNNLGKPLIYSAFKRVKPKKQVRPMQTFVCILVYLFMVIFMKPFKYWNYMSQPMTPIYNKSPKNQYADVVQHNLNL